MSVGFYLDQDRCAGCRACQVACKDKNRLDVGILYRTAQTYSVGSFPDVACYSYSESCNHCDDPICLHNCPTGAIYKAPDGTVIQDPSMCVGCRMCVMSCPYGHPKFIAAEGVSGKCDGCYGLRQEGSLPACVAGCPNRALDFGEISELEKKYGSLDRGSIAVLPSPDLTHPNVLIKAKEAAFAGDWREVTW
ncbi:4Fe-4S dicluster domain-containing protein [Adlercreutzia sp. ZJ473]|uniref:4Fe-4S dicluster domain-containing protein n=1 Tax=Adlercreutzia sp. ZJ473 TaxID=2722822 RepID=UPI0015556C30|nr:4Fe-4S dicluster domain-containing protein [Adlercreutzia sp. ZJ473]